MEKLFWDSFCNTGKIDMYLLYKDFTSNQDIEDIDTEIQEQPSLEETDQGGIFQ